MPVTHEQYGPLRCQCVDDLPKGTPPKLTVVACHGFGAPGDDLVAVGDFLLQEYPELGEFVRFVFPAAPLSLDLYGMPGGRAWWLLDIEKLNRMIQLGETRSLADELPVGLESARNQLREFLEEYRRRQQLEWSQFVLGGFSQGAMITTELTLQLGGQTAGLFALSGTLLCQDIWRELAGKAKKVPVLQSHGTRDPILPFVGATALRDLLAEAGFPVEFIEFAGAHTIPMPVLSRLAEFLRERAESE